MTKNQDKTESASFKWTAPTKKILEPFAHQVSGRAHMLTLDDHTLCKSLSMREWNFYDKLPLSMRRFTPNPKGLLFVHLIKENCTSHRFVSSDIFIPTSIHSKLSNPRTNSNHFETNKCYTGDNLVEDTAKDRCWSRVFEQTLFKGLERIEYNATDGFTGHAWTVDKDQEAATQALGRNPWALRQHHREIDRTLKGDVLRKEIDLLDLCKKVGLDYHEKHLPSDCYTKVYLLLEDVTHSYKFPSILDLKIGTQLDRPGCSPAKKDKHYNLVQKSSTGSLGLRLAGMQVYQVNSKQYLCRDKYYGRGLSAKGFNDALAQFLHNGVRTVVDVIPPIVSRIQELRSELEKQDSFRFHASSLLIVYESDDLCDAEIQKNPSTTENHIQGDNKTDGDEKTKTKLNPLRVSVHMIDFAHSTFKGFLEDKTVYQGPDVDCLYALDNLITVLNSICKPALPN